MLLLRDLHARPAGQVAIVSAASNSEELRAAMLALVEPPRRHGRVRRPPRDSSSRSTHTAPTASRFETPSSATGTGSRRGRGDRGLGLAGTVTIAVAARSGPLTMTGS